MGMTRGRRAEPEHVEQAMLFDWAERASGRTPELKLLFAIPNAGGYTGGFKANVARVMKMKREGVKSGVPDLMWPVARGRYHGLFIEMKAGPTSRVRPEQKEWHAALRAQGYAVRVSYSWDAARDTIERYNGLGAGSALTEPTEPIRGVA